MENYIITLFLESNCYFGVNVAKLKDYLQKVDTIKIHLPCYLSPSYSEIPLPPFYSQTFAGSLLFNSF